MAKRVSKTYGDALFDLALELDKVDTFYQEIQELQNVFREEEDLTRLLYHPEVIKEEKLSFIENVFSGRISEEIMGFLCIIIQKDRAKDIPDIFDYFIHRIKEHKGIGIAYVTSAVPLSESQKKRLTDKLLATTSYHTFEMNYHVDGSVLGGLIIRIGDRIMDSSLKTQLEKLNRQLSGIRVSD